MTAASSAELILRNGRIYAVDAMRSWASAVAIDKGRFVAVGDDAAVEGFKGPFTEIVDLKGRMAMPGVVDIHARVLMGEKAALFDLDIASDDGVDRIGAEASGWAEAAPLDDWRPGAPQAIGKSAVLDLASAPPELAKYRPKLQQASAALSIQTLNSFGVTAFLEAASTPEIMRALRGLDERGALTAWAGCAIPAVGKAPLSENGVIALRDNYRSHRVKPDFVTVDLDSARLCASAAMSAPELISCLRECETMGLSAKILCASDAAVTQALDAIEFVRNRNGQTLLTHQIAHAGYIAPSDVHRFGELGVVLDLSPSPAKSTRFLGRKAATTGAGRARDFSPTRDLLLSGALIASGSRAAGASYPGPWAGIERMITRRDLFGDGTLRLEQALDLESAIEISTINGAQAMQLDDITGSIEIGKSADLIMLDRNLFDTPADQIADTKVLATYFDGRLVHEQS